MGLREIGLEFERTAIAGDRFVELANRAASFAEIGMSGRIFRVEDDSLPNPRHGKVRAPGLVGDDTKEVQRVGVVWLRGKDLPVKRLGIRQPPGLVARERQIESLRNRHSLNLRACLSRPRAFLSNGFIGNEMLSGTVPVISFYCIVEELAATRCIVLKINAARN